MASAVPVRVDRNLASMTGRVNAVPAVHRVVLLVPRAEKEHRDAMIANDHSNQPRPRLLLWM
jgi:hypothetical protein